MVRQIGFTPKEFAQMIIDKEGGADKAQQLFNSSSDMKSDYKQSVVPDDSAGGKYSKILRNIFKNNYDFSDYARAANIYWPGNKIGHGREDIEKFWNNLNTCFDKDKSKLIYDLCLDQEKLEKTKVHEFMELFVK